MELALDAPTVTISNDGVIATMARGTWRLNVRAKTLGEWLQFYRGLAARQPAIYAPWLTEIERAMTRAAMAVPAAKPEPGAPKAGSAKRRKAWAERRSSPGLPPASPAPSG